MVGMDLSARMVHGLSCGVGLPQFIASGFTKDDYDMDGS